MTAEEKPLPSVPPSDHRQAGQMDRGSRVIESERLGTECPQCGGPMVYREIATGERIVACWDPAEFDPETYQLATSYERHERAQECDHCGWRVDL
jgi:ssDNA-binding Zn-finger/Zn-ribbon topoisomerase 1